MAAARDSYLKPDAIVSAMGIKEDSTLADIGCATGYFTLRFAKAATKGKVTPENRLLL